MSDLPDSTDDPGDDSAAPQVERVVFHSPSAPAPDLAAPLRSPWHLLFWGALPTALLAVLVFSAYRLVAGELNKDQRFVWCAFMLAELLLALGYAAAAVVFHKRGHRLGALDGGLIAAAPLALLVTMLLGKIKLPVPPSVPAWLVSSRNLDFHHMVFLLPGIYFGVALILGVAHGMPRGDVLKKWIKRFCVALILLSFLGFVVMIAEDVWSSRIAGTFMLVGAGLLAVLTIKLLLHFYAWICRAEESMAGALALVLGVLLPAAGLAVNSWGHVPVDLRGRGIYGLAALTGLSVCLPKLRPLFARRAVWLLQCATLPFTLYFFVLFLPFLPFGILGLIVFFMGILFFIPTGLFMIHGRRVVAGLQFEWEREKPWRMLLAGLLACMLLPVGLLAGAWRDRVVLDRALMYVYKLPDAEFRGNSEVAARGVERLYAFKEPDVFPLIAEVYQRIVFEGATLPKNKLNRMHRIFDGTSLFVDEESRERRSERASSPERAENVVLQSMQVESTTRDRAARRSLVVFEMKNMSRMAAQEYHARFAVPTGALVSGFFLEIHGVREEGGLFPSKAALFIYERIARVEKRDPAILRYLDARTLELRVFPFASKETRRVWIEFTTPEAVPTTLRVGEKSLAIAPPLAEAPPVVTHTSEGVSVLLPAGSLPVVRATDHAAEVVVILPVGAGLPRNPERTTAVLKRLLDLWGADHARLCLVNHEVHLVDDGQPLALDAIEARLAEEMDRVPARGGCFAGRAIKRVLLSLQGAMDHDPEAWMGRVVKICIIAPECLDAVGDPGVADLLPYGPLVDGIWRMTPEESAPAEVEPDFLKAKTESDPAFIPVRGAMWLRCGGQVRAVPVAPDGGTSVAYFPSADLEDGVEYFAPQQGGGGVWRDLSQAVHLPSDDPYARALLPVLRCARESAAGRPPEQRALGLCDLARECRALCPQVAWTVFETPVQWKALEEAEKKQRFAHAVMEFSETAVVPEPSSVTLILLAGVAFALKRRRQD